MFGFNRGLPTSTIIKAKSYGLTLDEAINAVTGMHQIVVTRDGENLPLFSVFRMSGGVYRWEKNVTLLPHVLTEIGNRWVDEEHFLVMLDYVARELNDWYEVCD